ncbi:MAG TPA: exodeoxyribonuclease III [Polyangiales bacterium]|nr:exodeoxyribonuclease III [Polyangiales bacterium]
MNIATYNINGINGRLPRLLSWLAKAAPDVVCLQELKTDNAKFPHAAIEKAGYGAIWNGQRANNGVAILARGKQPIVTRRALPGDRADSESRYIEAAIEGVLVACLYAPNGNPQPGPRFTYKLRWLERLISHAAELFATGVPVVLAGDFNVVPTDFDIYSATSSWKDDALLQPAARAAYARLLEQGWCDALRARHPGERIYTFWDYLRNAWQRNAGLRIDHLLLSAPLIERLGSAGVDREERGQEHASDHAPAWIELIGSVERHS